jgi:DhnA family fructose-bisphosphate aldolase class Ia
MDSVVPFCALSVNYPSGGNPMPTTGESVRLARLFSQGQNVVIVAIDHGLYFGPLPGLISLPEASKVLAGADGVLLAPGMASHCQGVFSQRGAPAMIVRLNWATNYMGQWKYEHSHSVPMVSAADAVAQGADLLLASLTLQNPDEAENAGNVEMFAQYASEKRALGMPLVGEVFPTGGDDANREDLHEQVYVGCRIIAELGADLVKTFYTGPKFKDVVAATPVPILALGAKKMPHEKDALDLAAAAVRDGARGVVFGRNVVQSSQPERFLDALKEVVKAGKAPEAVAKKFGLD